jgi:ribosomal protein L14
MIFKQTKIVPIDRSGVLVVRVFHLYRGSKRKMARVGDFVKASAIQVKPEN